MSMRLYSKADFEAELRKRKIEKTKFSTGTMTLWQDDNGFSIFIEHELDVYPDYLLDNVLSLLNKLYECGGPTISRSYTVE